MKTERISIRVSEDEKKEINLIELLSETKYGFNGMGGIKCNGLMYVGYPR